MGGWVGLLSAMTNSSLSQDWSQLEEVTRGQYKLGLGRSTVWGEGGVAKYNS